MSTAYDFTARALDGREVPIATYRGEVLLIVNVASRCGFTPQYEGLEALYDKFKGRGFCVLGFPCNQFGAQEPGDAAAIGAFCSKTYGVDFPMFAKIEVNGAAAHPLYRFLTAEKTGLLGSRAIKWNFTKFLVDRAGAVVARYAPIEKPQALESRIEALLG